MFDSGYKSETLGIILDSVEKIIEYSKLGNHYNNKILQVIYTILDKVIENYKSVYIILTSSNSELMDLLDLTKICHYSFELLDDVIKILPNWFHRSRLFMTVIHYDVATIFQFKCILVLKISS